jgi:hypothetical protein
MIGITTSATFIHQRSYPCHWNGQKGVQYVSHSTTLAIYLSGMNREEWVAPIPGLPCFTGLYEMENSAK